MKNQTPIQEQTYFGALLTMAAGGIDAYSFLFHGEVFAGLQTGNLILIGVNLGKGDLAAVLRYLTSIIAFFVGTIIIRILQKHAWLGTHDSTRRKVVLTYEIVLLALVALLTSFVPSLITTIILSITAAAELQEFRKLNGGPFTPLMMTGNLRMLGETSLDAIAYHDAAARKKFSATITIMTTFAIGALLVAALSPLLHQLTVVIPMFVLLVPLLILNTTKVA